MQQIYLPVWFKQYIYIFSILQKHHRRLQGYFANGGDFYFKPTL